jgi:hypothetical protein
MNSTATVTDLISPEVRAELTKNAEAFEVVINKAFEPYKVVFVPGYSLSKMVKESPIYKAFNGDKKKEGPFFNEIKSLAKASKLGERMTVEAIIRDYWIRFNGTGKDKDGKLNRLNVTLMAPELKASKMDVEIQDRTERAALASEKEKLVKELADAKSRIIELENVTITKVS